MGFWPFGKTQPADDAAVEYVSRVVTTTLASGGRVRGKLVLHFKEPIAPADADRTLATAIAAVTRASEMAHALADLSSPEVAARLLGELPDNVTRPRSLELVALHHVDEGTESSSPSSIPARPLSERPGPPSERPPSARPPSTPPPRSSPPPAAGAPPSSRPPPAVRPEPRRSLGSEPRIEEVPGSVARSSRRSSSQILMARETRLVPLGATAEAAGKSLVPLLRDAATKLELGILRAYDLIVVRRALSDDPDDALLEAMIPVSTAPLGLFAESRSDELERWAKALGDERYEALEGECAAMVSFLLYDALRHAQIEAAAMTVVVEKMSDGAFPSGKAALADLGRFLHPTEATAAAQFAKGVVVALGHAEELEKLGSALTPLLASLQDDLAMAAAQVRSAVGRPPFRSEPG